MVNIHLYIHPPLLQRLRAVRFARTSVLDLYLIFYEVLLFAMAAWFLLYETL